MLWSTLALAIPIEEVPNPRDRGSWVTDLAEVLEPSAEARIDSLLGDLEQDTGVEVAVVTVPQVPGVPKDFATGLFAHWGIGKAGEDNGLLVLLVMDQRRLEMETGYGLEPLLTDSWLGAMQQSTMVPRFKEDDYGGGLVDGLVRIDQALREGDPVEGEWYPKSAETTRSTRHTPPIVAPSQGLPSGVVWGVGSLALGGAGLLTGRAVLRRRERTCTNHEAPVLMTLVDEVADDAHLDAGQQAEEQVGSVDYQVFSCPECDELRVYARNAWFSGYQRCHGCSYKTADSTSVTLKAATQHSTGLKEVTTDCRHCGAHSTRTVVIPRRPKPSSSSGGSSGRGGRRGGRGFGGGRSGGGGAGSSW